jgi:hypothetical protein
LKSAAASSGARGQRQSRPDREATSSDPAAFSQLEETAMSLFHYRTRPDRRFGFVLIAVFTLGILGGSLATFLNGGVVPATHTATVHLTKTAAPL